MSKPKLTLHTGGKVEAVEVPNEQHFACWHCGKDCVVWPRATPIAVQHSLPTCTEWKKSEASISIGSPPVFMEQFLEKCGVMLHKPERT